MPTTPRNPEQEALFKDQASKANREALNLLQAQNLNNARDSYGIGALALASGAMALKRKQPILAGSAFFISANEFYKGYQSQQDGKFYQAELERRDAQPMMSKIGKWFLGK